MPRIAAAWPTLTTTAATAVRDPSARDRRGSQYAPAPDAIHAAADSTPNRPRSSRAPDTSCAVRGCHSPSTADSDTPHSISIATIALRPTVRQTAAPEVTIRLGTVANDDSAVRTDRR